MTTSRPTMPRRVVVARGGSISASSGLGRAHSDMISHLRQGRLENYELIDEIEHPLGGSAIQRVWRRWRTHPRKVAKRVAELANAGKADILHISDQEQAGLVPKNSPIPVAVTVHDLFHLDPQVVETPEGPIWVGDNSPGLIRKRDIAKIRSGLSRADLLICDSKTTQEHAKRLFPNSRTVTVPLGIDVGVRNPHNNPQKRPEFLSNANLNLLAIGSEEPRKRMEFAIDVIAGLPEQMRTDIVLHKVGAESNRAIRERLISRADNSGVKINWLGGLDEADLIATEQHADALLFPSVAEGFGYPPLEAMAAGCPVLMSDLGSHNELAVVGTPLSPFEKSVWIDAICNLHDAWMSREKNPREADDKGLERAQEYSTDKFILRLKDAYDLSS